MLVNAYPTMLVSAMGAIRVSEAMLRAAASQASEPDRIPEAMSSLMVAKLAHGVAIRLLSEADETMETLLDIRA